jgi:hypothetical protein
MAIMAFISSRKLIKYYLKPILAIAFSLMLFTAVVVHAQTTSTTDERIEDRASDFTKPIITLIGADSITITEGDLYTDDGATASDNFDGDLTSEIVTFNPVDTETAGAYEVTYNVSDSAGNSANEVVRKVKVEELIIATTTFPDAGQENTGTTTPESTDTGTTTPPDAGQANSGAGVAAKRAIQVARVLLKQMKELAMLLLLQTLVKLILQSPILTTRTLKTFRKIMP